MKKLILVLAVLVALPAIANAKKPRAKRKARIEVAAPETAKFVLDSARIKGTIEGYGPSWPFKTGQMALHNPFTGAAMPQAFLIAEDGTFEVEFPVWFPSEVSMDLGGLWIPIYVGPGATVEVRWYLDDVTRTRTWAFSGDLARQNNEMKGFQRTQITRSQYDTMSNSSDWKIAEGIMRGVMDENLRSMDEALAAGAVSEDVYRLLRYKEQENFAEEMLSYAGSYDYYNNGKKVPREFYSFMREIPFDDPGFLTFAGWVIPNRLEFMKPLRDSYYSKFTGMSFPQYLESKGVEVTDDERRSAVIYSSYSKEEIERLSRIRDDLKARYADMHEEYQQYSETIPTFPDAVEGVRLFNAHADSVWQALTGRPSGLMMDIVAMQELKNIQREAHLSPADIVQIHRAVYDNVEHPFLRDEVWRNYEALLPKMGNMATELPEGPATEILRGIVDRFKGKPVLIDFWGTACGPCVATLKDNKEQRAKVEEKGGVTLVYITCPSWSPRLAEYDQFVADNALTNSFRISNDDWNLLSPLFNLSSVPRYIHLDEQGRVLNEHHSGAMNEFL